MYRIILGILVKKSVEQYSIQVLTLQLDSCNSLTCNVTCFISFSGAVEYSNKKQVIQSCGIILIWDRVKAALTFINTTRFLLVLAQTSNLCTIVSHEQFDLFCKKSNSVYVCENDVLGINGQKLLRNPVWQKNAFSKAKILLQKSACDTKPRLSLWKGIPLKQIYHICRFAGMLIL